jgi:hypothetical protein
MAARIVGNDTIVIGQHFGIVDKELGCTGQARYKNNGITFAVIFAINLQVFIDLNLSAYTLLDTQYLFRHVHGHQHIR